jgi:hypothetical protein
LVGAYEELEAISLQAMGELEAAIAQLQGILQELG